MVAQMVSCKSSVKSAHRGREMNLTPFAQTPFAHNQIRYKAGMSLRFAGLA